jgi:hypothetical protein
MNTPDPNQPWLRYDEAMERVRGYVDPALEQFVMRGVTLVIQDYGHGRAPCERLDMLYFVTVLEQLFAQRDALARIFAGEDLRAW